MAKILVVDDDELNRELLAALIEHRGHQPLQAGDGAQALAVVRAEHPELVISDILMPTMDGYEFVRQLRADPAIATTEVIFFSANYREREARNLARACGVSRVLLKSCGPEELLHAIDQALAHATEPVDELSLQEFDRDHLRVMADKLMENVAELEAANRRRIALTDLNLHLASERNPHTLMDKVCRGARDLIGAKYAVLCVTDRNSDQFSFFTSGIEAELLEELERPQIERGMLGMVRADGQPRRMVNTDGDPRCVGLPMGYPSLQSCVAVPVSSLTRVYGWLCLADKLGSAQFSDEDEQILTILAAQVGRNYENGILYREAQHHAEELQMEIAARKHADIRIEGLNRLYAVLSSISSAIVRVTSRDELFNEACRIAVDAGRFRTAWIGLTDLGAGSIVPIASAGTDVDFLQSAGASFSLRDRESPDRALIARAVLEQAVRFDNGMHHPSQADFKAGSAPGGSSSMAALPLLVAGEAVGVLVLVASGGGFFDAEELKLLTELAGNIAFALDLIEKRERLDYLARYDVLTGLPNRAWFLDWLGHRLRMSNVEAPLVAVVLLDLERFRRVNETLGRPAGDELLRGVAARMQASNETAARIGADVFALSLHDMHSAKEVSHELAALVASCFNEPFKLQDELLSISCRTGVSLFPSDGADAETLLRNAEVAIRNSRQSGERRMFYASEMNSRMADALAIESRLRHAVERNEFVLHYQPKIRMGDGCVVGVEALIRWQDPGRGLIAPGVFIPILEETGMIDEVGRWAIERALRDLHSWTGKGLAIPRVAVNVSAIQLQRADFVDSVIDAIHRAGDAPETLDLEITESLIMRDVEASIGKLRILRGLGIHIDMDDFGTGHSSLSYIERLPLDKIKIDRSFIVGMGEQAEHDAIVSGIIALVHSLGLHVVAEGIETYIQGARLAMLGCDEVQGFYYSRPVPWEKLAASYPMQRGA